MADPVDEAQMLEEAFRISSIAAVTNRTVPSDFDGKHCYDCGEDIPKARLAITGVYRCVGCQTVNDNMAKHQRKQIR